MSNVKCQLYQLRQCQQISIIPMSTNIKYQLYQLYKCPYNRFFNIFFIHNMYAIYIPL
jgi:hypothetical protein